jgi:hypothetical protein
LPRRLRLNQGRTKLSVSGSVPPEAGSSFCIFFDCGRQAMSAFRGKADMIIWPLYRKRLSDCDLATMCFPKVCPSRVRRLTIKVANFGVRPIAGHIEPSKTTCRIRPTTNANLTVTPPIFCTGSSADRSATAGAHLPPKYPGCRDVTQDFAQSVSGQHGQTKYLSRRGSNRQTN